MRGKGHGRRWMALVAVLAVAPAAAALGSHVDSMYFTLNYAPGCTDGSPGSGFCQTDNATLVVHRGGNLTQTGKDNIAWTLNNSWDTTDLNVSYDSTPVTSGSAETDIMYTVNPGVVPGTLDGITWCDDAVTSEKCDQHYVAFDTATPYRALACHETGHSVGLTHGQQAFPQISNGDDSLACMTTNPIESMYVGTHNVTQVNATY